MTYGGDEGSRTPVRKCLLWTFSGRSRLFTFPHRIVNRHTRRLGSFIYAWRPQSLSPARSPLKRHHPARFVALPGSASAHSGRRSQSLIRPRQQRNSDYRCSLIYRCPLVSGWAPLPAYPASTSPSKPVHPHMVRRRRACGKGICLCLSTSPARDNPRRRCPP